MDFLAELGFKTEVVIYEDNNGVLANLDPIQMNDTVKHIRTKFWYIREASRSCIMRKVHTYWQLADIGTKIHNAATWLRLLDAIRDFDPEIDYSTLTPDS